MDKSNQRGETYGDTTTGYDYGSSDRKNDDSERKRLNFDGELTKTGLTISVAAVGGAILYAFGIILVVLFVTAAVISLAVYLRYR